MCMTSYTSFFSRRYAHGGSGGAIFSSPRSRHRQRIVMLADGVITVRIKPSFLPCPKGLLPNKLALIPAAG